MVLVWPSLKQNQCDVKLYTGIVIQEGGSNAEVQPSGILHKWWMHQASSATFPILTYYIIPVVPHKAVAEVSKIGNL